MDNFIFQMSKNGGIRVTELKKLKIAVLFDGAGLARLGLEQAGHDCTGYELDPLKHMLSKYVGSGNSILADATKVDLTEYDAVWASPPCQSRSTARTQGEPTSSYAGDYLDWSLQLPHKTLWVENVIPQGKMPTWGKAWNAAQFTRVPIQNRNRMIGGRYLDPGTFSDYKKAFPGICPCITASEYKGCGSDKRRASRFYGRRLTIEECAYHMGFDIPKEWHIVPEGMKRGEWQKTFTKQLEMVSRYTWPGRLGNNMQQLTNYQLKGGNEVNEKLAELEDELLKIRQECYFNRGVLPIEEWREYHLRINVIKQKILAVRFALAPSID